MPPHTEQPPVQQDRWQVPRTVRAGTTQPTGMPVPTKSATLPASYYAIAVILLPCIICIIAVDLAQLRTPALVEPLCHVINQLATRLLINHSLFGTAQVYVGVTALQVLGLTATPGSDVSMVCH